MSRCRESATLQSNTTLSESGPVSQPAGPDEHQALTVSGAEAEDLQVPPDEHQAPTASGAAVPLVPTDERRLLAPVTPSQLAEPPLPSSPASVTGLSSSLIRQNRDQLPQKQQQQQQQQQQLLQQEQQELVLQEPHVEGSWRRSVKRKVESVDGDGEGEGFKGNDYWRWRTVQGGGSAGGDAAAGGGADGAAADGGARAHVAWVAGELQALQRLAQQGRAESGSAGASSVQLGAVERGEIAGERSEPGGGAEAGSRAEVGEVEKGRERETEQLQLLLQLQQRLNVLTSQL
ncbi:unnamed protein product [Closterium sp. NIES-53]